MLKTCSAKDGDAGNKVLRRVMTSGDSRLARLISNVKEDRAEWRVMGMFVETYMDNALPRADTAHVGTDRRIVHSTALTSR